MNPTNNTTNEHPKEDSRPPRYGWAPGKYLNKCKICNCSFIGDKRAQDCADCAYTLPDPTNEPPEKVNAGNWKQLVRDVVDENPGVFIPNDKPNDQPPVLSAERVEELKALYAKATPGPWRNCGKERGGCQCCQIWSETVDAPIGETTHGKWGDSYPTLRGVGGDSMGSIGCKVEAVMEMIEYGEVPEEAGKANAALIAALHNSFPSLIHAAEMVERLQENAKDLAAEYDRSTESALKWRSEGNKLMRERDTLQQSLNRALSELEEVRRVMDGGLERELFAECQRLRVRILEQTQTGSRNQAESLLGQLEQFHLDLKDKFHERQKALSAPSILSEWCKREEWQDIATAPKDGTGIIVACIHGLYSVCWENHNIAWWHVDDNKHGPYPLRGTAPTHWKHLPPAPTTLNHGGEAV